MAPRGEPRSLLTVIVLPACLTIASGCGRASTLHLRDGTVVSGEVIDRYDGKVVVRDRRGHVSAVRRQQIKDVDHPGTAAIIVGASLIATGAVLAYATANAPCDSDDPNLCREEQSVNELSAGAGFVALALPGATVLS